MVVRDWMSPDPITVGPDTTVAEARLTMEEYGIRHLPVVDDGQLVGILSDRDVVIHARALRAALRSNGVEDLLDDTRSVESIMTSGPQCVGPDDPMAAAARLMLSRRINALPVVSDHRLVGVITTVDCLLASLGETAEL